MIRKVVPLELFKLINEYWALLVTTATLVGGYLHLHFRVGSLEKSQDKLENEIRTRLQYIQERLDKLVDRTNGNG